MKIIVLNKTPYHEKDILIHAITDEKYISFIVKGGASATNPFIWINNPLTVADIDFVDGNYKNPVLKRAKLISSPMSGKQSLDQMASINAVIEIINKMYDDEEKCLSFNDTLEFLEENKKSGNDSLLLLLIFFARTLKNVGADINVTECVCCGSKTNIVAFSFEEGGFVCKHCLHEGINKDLTANQMKLLRYIFLTPKFNFYAGDEITDKDKKILLYKMNGFSSDVLGVELNSLQLI